MLFHLEKLDCVDPILNPVNCPTVWEVPERGTDESPAEISPGEEDLVNAVVGPYPLVQLTEGSTWNPVESIRGLVVLPDNNTRTTQNIIKSTRSNRTTLFVPRGGGNRKFAS